jgi:hypothetical protein
MARSGGGGGSNVFRGLTLSRRSRCGVGLGRPATLAVGAGGGLAGTAFFLGGAFGAEAAGVPEDDETFFFAGGAAEEEDVFSAAARGDPAPLSKASAEKAAALVRLPRGASTSTFFLGMVRLFFFGEIGGGDRRRRGASFFGGRKRARGERADRRAAEEQ